MIAKLKAAARKAEKSALRDYKNWETSWEERGILFSSIYEAVFYAWMEATGRTVGETDEEMEANDHEFLDDPIADSVMAPYAEKYNY